LGELSREIGDAVSPGFALKTLNMKSSTNGIPMVCETSQIILTGLKQLLKAGGCALHAKPNGQGVGHRLPSLTEVQLLSS
jgi:hypothetical protein